MLLVARLAITVGVFGLFVSGVFCYWLAGVGLYEVAGELMYREASEVMGLEVISAIDKLFLGTGVFIMALGIFSLSIVKLDLPPALEFHDFHHLKSFFLNFLVVVMAIIFLENLALVESMIHEPNSTGSEILYTGIAFLLATIAVLLFQKSEVIFAYIGRKGR